MPKEIERSEKNCLICGATMAGTEKICSECTFAQYALDKDSLEVIINAGEKKESAPTFSSAFAVVQKYYDNITLDTFQTDLFKDVDEVFGGIDGIKEINGQTYAYFSQSKQLFRQVQGDIWVNMVNGGRMTKPNLTKLRNDHLAKKKKREAMLAETQEPKKQGGFFGFLRKEKEVPPPIASKPIRKVDVPSPEVKHASATTATYQAPPQPKTSSQAYGPLDALKDLPKPKSRRKPGAPLQTKSQPPLLEKPEKKTQASSKPLKTEAKKTSIPPPIPQPTAQYQAPPPLQRRSQQYAPPPFSPMPRTSYETKKTVKEDVKGFKSFVGDKKSLVKKVVEGFVDYVRDLRIGVKHKNKEFTKYTRRKQKDLDEKVTGLERSIEVYKLELHARMASAEIAVRDVHKKAESTKQGLDDILAAFDVLVTPDETDSTGKTLLYKHVPRVGTMAIKPGLDYTAEPNGFPLYFTLDPKPQGALKDEVFRALKVIPKTLDALQQELIETSKHAGKYNNKECFISIGPDFKTTVRYHGREFPISLSAYENNNGSIGKKLDVSQKEWQGSANYFNAIAKKILEKLDAKK